MSPIVTAASEFSHFDLPDFKSLYLNANERVFRVQVEGARCVNCVKKIEGLQARLNEVESIRLNLGSGELRVVFKASVSAPHLSHVMEHLVQLGYKPTAVVANESSESVELKANRRELIRLGVAFALSSNIMMFAIAQYAGALGAEDRFFGVFSFLLMIPYMGFVAIPFYQGSWRSLKNKELNVDAPLTLALVTGFLFSSYNLWRGEGSLYFDSLTSFTTLILLTRYLQKKLLKTFTSQSPSTSFSGVEKISTLDASSRVIFKPAKNIQPGDHIVLQSGDYAPTDVELLSQQVEVNFQLTTGESQPKLFSAGMTLPHGSQLISAEAQVRALKIPTQTVFGSFLAQLQATEAKKSKMYLLSEKWAQNLVALVFSLAALVFLYFLVQGQTVVAIERSLALLIVACPCALAFGTPLAISFALTRARRRGILIKNADVLENLSQVKLAYFDKTGTLTSSQLRVLRTEPQVLSLESIGLILGMEQSSNHPVAFALREHFKHHSGPKAQLRNVQEIPGQGVIGTTPAGQTVRLSAPKSETEENQKAVVLYIDELPVAQIFLEAEVLFESGALFKLLQKKSIQVGILSGDSAAQVKAVGQKLNITNLLWSQKPQDKARQIESSPNCLFVGDGVNDTLAFKKALVAVAVSGSLTEALKSADVYLVKPGLKSLEELFITSDLALLLIKRNLVFSAVYNFLAGGAAVLGLVNPLVAAVLMPISSVSMLLLTHFGAKK